MPIRILPGQYFDKETNLHYNAFRDYDPAIGRYVQSDPIGLAGGLNTYGYANQNPLGYVDPHGLNPLEPIERHVLAHASRGNWKEALKTLEEIADAGRAKEVLQQCVSRRSAQLVREFKQAGVGTGARSGQHGAPFSRAGAQLRREANEIEALNPELATTLRTLADRLIQQGRSISHR
jgi:RHS repeat-associated protein